MTGAHWTDGSTRSAAGQVDDTVLAPGSIFTLWAGHPFRARRALGVKLGIDGACRNYCGCPARVPMHPLPAGGYRQWELRPREGGDVYPPAT